MLRIVLHRILMVIAVPIVFVGLIDPLEGGVALIAAGVIYLVAFLLAGYGPKKYLWIPYLASIVIGIVVILFAVFGLDRVDNEPDLLPLTIGNWLYRVSVLITLAGALTSAILSFRKSR